MVSCGFTDPELLGEPSLEELFSEPIVQLVMARDGVRDADLRGAIETIKSRYEMPETVH